MKKIIGVDLDDVLLDCRLALCEFHNARYDNFLTKEEFCQHYNLEELWKCSTEEAIKRVVEFYNSEEHLNALPIIGASEAIKELSQNNSLFIVTVKPEYLRDSTHKWLVKNNLDFFDGVYFTNKYLGDNVKKTKGKVCDELRVEVFIDDALSNAIDVRKEGRDVLLFDSPWNQGELPINTKRVYSWREILEILS